MKSHFLICLVLLLFLNVSVQQAQTLKDLDGNSYKVVKIDNKFYMAENLRVKHYQNGDPVADGTTPSEWNNLGEQNKGAFTVYDNNSSNADKYGYLYNYYAASDSRNICPCGWKIPSQKDWEVFYEKAYKRMSKTEKENFIVYSGFRYGNGSSFNGINSDATYWASTSFSDKDAWEINFSDNYGGVLHTAKKLGLAIRCMSDDPNVLNPYQTAIEFKYEHTAPFQEGMGFVGDQQRDGTIIWALIDSTGKMLTDYIFPGGSFAMSPYFSNGLAVIHNGKAGEERKYGFIDKTGKQVIGFLFSEADKFDDNGYAVVKQNGRYGVINKNGELTVQCIYKDRLYFEGGLAPVLDEAKNLWGFIDYKGQMIIKPAYKDVNKYSNEKDFLIVKDAKDKWGFINNKGKVVIKPIYDEVRGYDAASGLIAVKDSKTLKWGFINKSGKQVIPFTFNDVKWSGFRNGYAVVKGPEYYGIINKKGEFVYGYENKFNGEIDRVYGADTLFILKGTGIILPNGKVIKKAAGNEFNYLQFHDGIGVTKTEVFRTDGTTIIEPGIFTDMEYYGGSLIAARKNGRMGYIRLK